ncbi:outer membrane beta-barrel protein [Myroides sp.]|uniref:outer membrane beta-barrel protein n=1 Tax=Myroides sp. TaxID=1874736 RepID=UPI003F3B210C
MNDKWINDLEQKMKGHTEVGPEGLWEDLEQKLFAQEKGKVIPLYADTVEQINKAKLVNRRNWVKRLLAIAACIIAVTTIGIQFLKQEGELLPNINVIKEGERKNIVDSKEHIEETKELQGDEKAIVSNYTQELKDNDLNKPKGIGTNENKVDRAVVESLNIGQELVLNPIINTDKIEELSIALIQDKHTDVLKEGQIKEKLVTQIEPQKRKGLSLGLLSSNMTSNSSQAQTGYASMNGAVRFDSKNPNIEIANTALAEIYTANLDKEVNTKINHKQPLRFGLSVSYALGDKWGLNSGITYTKLSSDLNSGSLDNKIMMNQTLYYIGIPVQVNYNIWQKGNFSAYVNGGALVEKAISGTLTTKYKIGDKIKEEPKENINTKSIQASVNMSVGMEYKLGKGVGLFVEPGVRYYFDDNSSISTIYKEKPFNFNAQIGLRYSIPTKK